MSLKGMAPLSAFAVYNKRKRKQQRAKTEPVSRIEPPKKLKSENRLKDKSKIEENGKTLLVTAAKTEKKTGKKKQKVSKRAVKKKDRSIGKLSKFEDDPPLLIPIDTETVTSGRPKTVHLNQNHEINPLINIDPSNEGLKLFKWMIAPVKPAQFFEKYWESKVLYINRNDPSYYKDVFSTKRLNNIFREFPLYYTRNVDVVSYENGVKQVHNEEGKVSAPGLYDYYLNGCSIRVLNPQTYDNKVYLLISHLQEYFGCMVGTNVYLTPPGSQGFAPHYDDIEAFIIQLEGRKYWKLYKPVGSDVLARDSSPNLKREDIGEPFMEVTLNAGDILYFPRGTIHEGRTDEEAHSLHITVSAYQHNSYADLLEHILPEALKMAASENIHYRTGLPLNYLSNLGYVNKDKDSDQRQLVKKQVKKLIEKLFDYADIDKAVDKLGRKFIYDSMPPALLKDEVHCTSKGDGDYLEDGRIFNRVEIEADTEVRLPRYHCLRLVVEEDAKIYYNVDNAKVYHGEEEQFLVVDSDLVPCIKKLQNNYPKFMSVEQLPCNDYIKKAQLVSDLWEKGLLVTNGPLNQISDGENEEDEEDLLSDVSL